MDLARSERTSPQLCRHAVDAKHPFALKDGVTNGVGAFGRPHTRCERRCAPRTKLRPIAGTEADHVGAFWVAPSATRMLAGRCLDARTVVARSRDRWGRHARFGGCVRRWNADAPLERGGVERRPARHGGEPSMHRCRPRAAHHLCRRSGRSQRGKHADGRDPVAARFRGVSEPGSRVRNAAGGSDEEDQRREARLPSVGAGRSPVGPCDDGGGTRSDRLHPARDYSMGPPCKSGGHR